MLDLSVLDVCECGEDLLPHGLVVVNCGDHHVLAHVEDSLDWGDDASCSSAEDFEKLLGELA
jgi:hypothetical protein